MVLRLVARLILPLMLPVACFCQQLGSWQDHLPYQQGKHVSMSGNRILCATPYAVFSVDLKDNTIGRLSKVNGLSETEISTMATDEQTGKTVIAYKNGNINLLTNSGVINLYQIKQSSIPGAKDFSDISFLSEKAYLSARFGIVVIDLARNEIKETYFPGANGRQLEVYSIAADSKYIYAATGEGLKRAPVSGVNLADYRSWIRLDGIDGVPKKLVAVSDLIVAGYSDSLFIQENESWRFLYASTGVIHNVRSSSGKLVIAETEIPGEGKVVVMEPSGFVDRVYSRTGITAAPKDALMFNNDVWIADSVSGLVQTNGSDFKTFQPNSPLTISTGEMLYADHSIWVSSGNNTGDYETSFSRNGFFQFNNMQWKNFSSQEFPILDTVYDISSVAASRSDQSVWFGALNGGLVRFKAPGQMQIFKHGSGLAPSVFHSGQYRVAGLAFDADEQLWVSNYGAAEPLVVRKNDGSWRRFKPPFALIENAVGALLVDDFNQKWILSPKGNGLLVFSHGLNLENTGDDQWKLLRTGKGNGNLPDNNVQCIAKDKSGFIWIGTSRGIGVIQCTGEIFTGNSCEAMLPVVQQDNFAGYLFSNESVQHIAVDGADRKWIATKNGAWLITADGRKTIHHFTSENSPLFSNDVKRVTIDPLTGDVFFATSLGITSFRGAAIEGTPVNQEIKIYPNPVPPGYTGSIAIRGLVSNAIVKITELDGRLVYQTRALGGQATWNGRDYRGRQISSGVYLVIISDDSRQEKSAGKIVFISP